MVGDAVTGLSLVRATALAGLPLLIARGPSRDLPQPSPFGVGERLEYAVSFGPVHVGSAEMSLIGVDTLAGQPAWHALLAISGGIPFFHVHDSTSSWFSPGSFISRRFVQRLREGRYHADRDFRMDPGRRVYTNDTSVDSLPSDDPVDDISMLYFVRTLPLADGDRYEFRRYFQSTGNPIVIRVLRRERVTVPAGSFDAIVVEPSIATPGIFSQGGHAQVWLSADSARFILQLKAHVTFGSLNLFLTKVTPGAARTE
jgi:hypothetical protein